MIMKTLQEKIIVLWTVFLLGTLFHTQLGLMPLFHGINIAKASEQGTTNIAEIANILWLMLAFFTIPMAAMTATAFSNTKRYRTFHFGLTAIYSVLNLLHLILDLMVKPIVWSQITLMFILLIIGLLLNVVAWQWMKGHSHSQRAKARLTTSES
jgi:hypothetical protein